jgi:hypothetical protein
LPGNFKTIIIKFEKEEPLELTCSENDLISNTITTTVNDAVPLNYQLFENDALIFKIIKINYLILRGLESILRVHYNDFHLGIWTKKKDAISLYRTLVCIRILLKALETLWRKIQILELMKLLNRV